MANSATPLNTSVLRARHPSPEWDLDAINDSFHADHVDDIENCSNSQEPNSPTQTDDADEFRSKSNSTPTPTLSIAPVPPLVASSPVSASAPAPVNVRKWKDPFKQAQTLSKSYLKVRIETERIHTESKRARLELTSNKDLEIDHLKAAQQERQHQHELAMMEKRIFLAQLEAGNARGGGDGYNHGNNGQFQNNLNS